VAKIYQFPTRDDRTRIHCFVAMYARGRITRQTMMTEVGATMDEYGVSKLVMDGYQVRRASDIVTEAGRFPVVVLAGTSLSETGRCPVCGTCGGRYLAGGDERVTLFCSGCGAVYETKTSGRGSPRPAPEPTGVGG